MAYAAQNRVDCSADQRTVKHKHQSRACFAQFAFDFLTLVRHFTSSGPRMDGLWWLFLLFVIPILLWLAFLALSSCLGTNFRARVSGVTINPRRGAYDQTLFRNMTTHTYPSSEQIEMETMLNQREYPYEEAEMSD